MTARRLTTVAVAAILVAGCGADGASSSGEDATSAVTTAPEPTDVASATEPVVSDTATPTESAAPEPTAAPLDLPEADTNSKESAGFPDPSGPTSFLTDVEIGDHEEYERVVFTFTEDSEVPSWRVAYSDEIVESGSGRPVDIAGDAFLQVTMSGASGVDLSGENVVEIYTGPDRIAGEEFAASAVQEVVEAGDFEAVLEWGVGLDSERPFRVFTLEDPSRVVVDVMTS